jgi:hypothetical protein
VPANEVFAEPPAEFRAALDSLHAAELRPEISIDEAPSPSRLAPHSVALRATVAGPDDTELAAGKLVVLYDPAGNEAWDGAFRLVVFIEADLETELALDPLLPDVGWAWLTEALGRIGYHNLGGTVTRVASQSYGDLADRPVEGTVQLRASWTPDSSDLQAHVVAWGDLLCTVAGLPPLPAGVAPLPRRQRRPR